MADRVVKIKAVGKRPEMTFSYNDPELTEHNVIHQLGGLHKVVELAYRYFDRLETDKFLEGRKTQESVIPRLASMIRSSIALFSDMPGVTKEKALEQALTFATGEGSPFVSLTQDQINSAVDLATAEQKKRGRKAKAESAA